MKTRLFFSSILAIIFLSTPASYGFRASGEEVVSAKFSTKSEMVGGISAKAPRVVASQPVAIQQQPAPRAEKPRVIVKKETRIVSLPMKGVWFETTQNTPTISQVLSAIGVSGKTKAVLRDNPRINPKKMAVGTGFFIRASYLPKGFDFTANGREAAFNKEMKKVKDELGETKASLKDTESKLVDSQNEAQLYFGEKKTAEEKLNEALKKLQSAVRTWPASWSPRAIAMAETFSSPLFLQGLFCFLLFSNLLTLFFLARRGKKEGACSAEATA